MAQLLAWFASFLVATLITRLFVGITFVYVGASLIQYILDSLNSFLSQYQFYNLLLLAGFGKALSIVGAALLFKSIFLYLGRKAS